MKYTTGGVTGQVGQTLTVEVPVKGKAPKPTPHADTPSVAPQHHGQDEPEKKPDATKDAEFVEGVDVSSAQFPGGIKWDKVFAGGKRYMYAQVDKACADHIKAAKAGGLHVGAYQY